MYSSALKNIKFKFSIICSTSFVENSGDWTMKINGCRRVCWMPHCTFQLNLWQLGAIAIWKSRRRWCYSVLTLMNGSNWEWIQTLEWIRTETPHPRIPPLTSMIYWINQNIRSTYNSSICASISRFDCNISISVVFVLRSWSDLLTGLLMQCLVSICSSGSTGEWVSASGMRSAGSLKPS